MPPNQVTSYIDPKQYVDSKKSPKTKLVLGILAALILVGLIFYLFQKTTAKTYSVVTFSSKETNQIKTGDILKGKSIPDSTVEILFSPGNQKQAIKVDAEGNWSYSVTGVDNGTYILSVLLQDRNNNLISVKNYKLKVSGLDPLGKIKALFTPKKASAQENGFVDEPWAHTMLAQFGIQAVRENGEIIFYDASSQSFIDKYCQTGCLRPDFSTDQLVQRYYQDADFIVKVMGKLWDNDYDPIQSLQSYFDLTLAENNDTLAYVVNNYKRGVYPRPNAQGALKTTIDEETLRRLIREVEYQRGREAQPINYFEQFMDATDPIFQTKSFYKVLVVPKEASNQDKFNVILGTFLFSVSKYEKLAAQIEVRLSAEEAAKVSLNTTEMTRDVQAMRGVMREVGGLRYEVATSRFRNWSEELQHGDGFWASIRKSWEGEGLKIGNRLPKITQKEKSDISFGQALVDAGNGFVVKKEISGRLINKARDYILNAEGGKLRHLAPTEGEISQWLDQNLVVVIKQDFYRQLEPSGGAAFAAGRMVYISENAAAATNEVATEKLLITHEFVHVISAMNGAKSGLQKLGRFFNYSQGQDYKYGKLMSVLYELSTDILTSKISGVAFNRETSGYYILYSEQHNAMSRITNRLAQRNSSFTEADFFEFALNHGDDFKLVQKMVGKSPDQLSVDEFLSIFEEYIGKGEFDYILSWHERLIEAAEKQAAERFKKWIPAGAAGGVSLTMTAYFAATAHADEQIPDDAVLLPTSAFLDQISEAPPDATITQVDGNIVPGGQIDVNSVYSQGGIYLVPIQSEYETIWTYETDKNYQSFKLIKDAFAQVTVIDPNKILPGGEHCSGPCKVTLPANLPPGKYKITANLVRKGTNQVIDSDSYPITVNSPNQGAKKVTSLTIGSRSQDLNNPQAVKVNIKDNPFVAAEVKFSDGTSKFITLKFEKNPASQSTPIPAQSTPPNSSPSLPSPNGQSCTTNGQIVDGECTGQCENGCGKLKQYRCAIKTQFGTTGTYEYAGSQICSSRCTQYCQSGPAAGPKVPPNAPQDPSTCNGFACAPVNLTASCSDNQQIKFEWSATIEATHHYYNRIRVDDTSNPWQAGTRDGDYAENLANANSWTIPYTPGHTYSWWMEGVYLDEDSHPSSKSVHGLAITCPTPTPIPAPPSAQGTLTGDYCPNGVCSSPNGFINTCNNGRLKISWPVQDNAKSYLVRIDKDPDSWNGQYPPNSNTGDTVWDGSNLQPITNGRINYAGDTGVSADVGHNYKVWIHSAYDTIDYIGNYNGRYGPRIDGGIVTCH